MISGRWPYQRTEHGQIVLELPDAVELDGRRYLRARWESPHGVTGWDRDVAEQYREDAKALSRHLLVFRDGHYEVSHRDRYNPDHDQPVQHFLADHPLGQAVVAVVLFGTLIMLAFAAVSLYRAAKPLPH